MAVDERRLNELATGLDALDVPLPRAESRGRRLWRASWPKLLAIGIVLGIWQGLVWLGFKQKFHALPPPIDAFRSIFDNWSVVWQAVQNTMTRAFYGYTLALVIGTTIGALVARIPVLRAAIGSMITGLQTMPSVAWFPAALLLFGLNQSAIIFVVVLGAAPSIANGLINGIDNIPPVLLRAGRVLGARRFAAFRSVILPAAMPSFIGGLKQGWAFAWRSLLAGELLVLIPGYFTLGQQLDQNRLNLDSAGVYGMMIVIFVIGVLMDAFVFGRAERFIRRRYGLIDQASRA
jgi:NitT/TauT family transport system permease protein